MKEFGPHLKLYFFDANFADSEEAMTEEEVRLGHLEPEIEEEE